MNLSNADALEKATFDAFADCFTHQRRPIMSRWELQKALRSALLEDEVRDHADAIVYWLVPLNYQVEPDFDAIHQIVAAIRSGTPIMSVDTVATVVGANAFDL